MELFLADKLKSEETQSTDIEAKVLGFCEYCWNYDNLTNLTMFHNIHGAAGSHVSAHSECVSLMDYTKNLEFCRCGD